ncbi:MAG: hydroxypyruvate isomerase family protein [Halobacteriaceae archaeon]
MRGLSVYLNACFDSGTYPERVARAADLGADAVDVGLWDVDDLDAVADACEDHGVELAYTSGAVGPTNDPGAVDERVAEIRDAVETAERVGCRQVNVSPGQDLEGRDDAEQFEAVVEVLRRAAPAAEEAGVTLLLEPLNTRVDHPGVFLSSSYEGYKILTAVDSPNAKLLFDVYHQEITEGDVVRNLRTHADHVGHVHVADNPGRHEPGTGEIDYEFVVSALAETGYEGYLGCEFSPEGDPDEAVARVRDML